MGICILSSDICASRPKSDLEGNLNGGLLYRFMEADIDLSTITANPPENS